MPISSQGSENYALFIFINITSKEIMFGILHIHKHTQLKYSKFVE